MASDPNPTAEAPTNDAPVRRLLAGILALQVMVAIYFAKDLLLPIVLGFLLALTLSPIVRRGVRAGAPAPLTAAILVAGIAISGGAVVVTMGGTIQDWAEEAPKLGAKLHDRLSGVAASVEAVKEAAESVESIAKAEDGYVQAVSLNQPGLLTSAVSSAAGAGTAVALGLVLALFLLASGPLLHQKIVESFPTLSEKKNALRAVYDVERRISTYLFTITAINAGLGLCIGVYAYLIGMPYAAIWGLGAFLLNYLPYLGTMIGSGLMAAIALVTFDDPSYALLAPVGYLVFGTIEGQFVTPAVVGRRLEMNAVAVLLSVILWGWLWGVAGALLAVPILVVVKVICDNVESLRGLSALLGGGQRPAESEAGETALQP
ncbi:MAG: AI-2E family transporter [Pseudomonadota bacterium]